MNRHPSPYTPPDQPYSGPEAYSGMGQAAYSGPQGPDPRNPNASAAARRPEDPRFAPRCRRVLPIILILSLAVSAVLFQNEAGIGWPLILTAVLAAQQYISRKIPAAGTDADAGVSAAKAPAVRSNRYQMLLTALCLLSGIHICLTASPKLQSLDLLQAGILFLALLVETFREREVRPHRQILAFLTALFYPLLHLTDAFAGVFSLFSKKDGEKHAERTGTLRAVLIGLCVMFPLAAVILALLSSADLMFSRMMQEILDMNFNPGNVIGHAAWFLLAFVSLTAWWVRLPLSSAPEEKPASSTRRPGPAAAITILAPISFIYIVYCVISLRYGVFRSALPEGMTYAEYVHEGFYQLLAVTILNLVLIGVMRGVFARSRVIDRLLCLLSALTWCIILSGSARMFLYIRAYDLTFLRLFVLWFYLLLAVLLGLLVASILRETFPLLRASLVVIAVFYLAFAFSFPDARIADYNLTASAEPDIEYLSELSLDAAPVLAKDPAVLTACEENGFGMGAASTSQSFLNFNFSRARGESFLKLRA